MNMSFFARTLHRLRRSEGGFSLIETVVALGVLFVSLLVLARTAAIGFTDIAMSRQRQQANQIANQVLEQVRGLTYARVGQGLQTSDLAGDSNIILTCPEGAYYLECPSSNPDAEKIVHSENPPDDVPLMPHSRPFAVLDGRTTTFTASVYVTEAKLVPSAGAFRVTAHVTWTPAQRSGLNNFVTTQSLLYTPEGTTDAATGGGTSPFFYGTGSIGRAPVTMTPNPGVVGGTGLQGLPSWDSMTVNLYGLESSLQEQALTRTESKVVLTGASKVVSGVETLAGGDTAEAIADNDPATTPTTSSAPSSLMQSTVTAEISGGGNSIEAEAASGSGAAPCPTPTIKWLSGMESGTAASVFGEFGSTGGVATADSAIKRTGAYSLQVAQTAGGTATGKGQSVSPFPNVFVAHFAIRLASLPTANVPGFAYISGIGSPNTYMEFGYNASTNRFKASQTPSLTGTRTGVVESTMTVSAGTWYVVDLFFNGDTSPDSMEWKIDGVTQPSTAAPSGTETRATSLWLGATNNTAGFTANYDDMAFSVLAADYPLPDLRVEALLPNEVPSWSFASGAILEGNNQPIKTSSWTWLDDVPMNSVVDVIKQVSNDTTGYVEVGFQNTTENCILGVRALAHLSKSGNATTHGRTDVLEGSQVTTVNNGDHVVNNNAIYHALVATSGGGAWTTAKVNGLTSRIGYSSDANPDPYWYSLQLGMAYVTVGSGEEGSAGTETGSTASTTAASAGTPCGTPTQIDSRACTYAQEDYSTEGPPHLSLKVGETGSESAMARIYRFSPSTAPGSTSYVWGRRTAGGGGVGAVRETVVRYPGTHTFAPLPIFIGGSPAGWLGYWLKYDAGTSASSVSAEAGIGSGAPSFTSAGTISYWNGTGYSSMAPPAAGGAIPLTAVDFTSGGYRIEISGSLASSPSFTSQVPAVTDPIDTRNEARATLGSPVSGMFTYKTTFVSTGDVIADLTLSVDLGTLTATARYAP